MIPGGTFNYFARDLGSGETLDEALRIFDAPRLRHVHVGDVNGMIFLNNISFGAYPEILKRRESIYRRWGRSRIAAYWSALIAVWNLRHPLHLAGHAADFLARFVRDLAALEIELLRDLTICQDRSQNRILRRCASVGAVFSAGFSSTQNGESEKFCHD